MRALLVSAAFLALFAGAEAWRRWKAPPVEWSRKLVHFTGGAVVATFPWLFSSHWTVLALALAFAAVLGASRKGGLLPSIHGVERESQGGIYFPVAVYLLFFVGAERPAFYLVAVIAMVLADTFAALVGTAYGRVRYDVEGDVRSLEGSLAFFLTTFLGAHLPLLLLTEVDRAASVAIGLQVALLVTLFEAISLRGSDNLIVPLATYYLLVKMTPHTAEWILVQLGIQVAVAGLVAWLGWRTGLFGTSGVLAAGLFLYGALSLGGPAWGVAPCLLVAAQLAYYSLVRRRPPARPHQVRGVFYTCLVALLLLLAHNATGRSFYVPYTAALAAQSVLFGIAEGLNPWLSLAGGWLAVVPLSLALGPGGLSREAVLFTMALVGLAVLLFRSFGGNAVSGLPLLRRQAFAVGVATLLLLRFR